MFHITTLLLLIPFLAHAENVTIYGSAQTKSGKPNSATFSFKESPAQKIEIVKEKSQESKEKPLPDIQKASLPKEIHQLSEQNPKPFSISPQAEQNQIENTLYEGGNRIYDVQSFPLKDIKTITEPNIDPTISTYPEY